MMKQLFMHYFLLCSSLLLISACQKEGTENEDESGYTRIMRGGSWGTGYSDMRISSYWEMNASGHGSDLGFRLVMSAGE